MNIAHRYNLPAINVIEDPVGHTLWMGFLDVVRDPSDNMVLESSFDKLMK